MLNRLLGLGPAQLFRGMRQGNAPMMLGGVLLLLIRYHRRSTSRQAASFTLKPGQSAAMRVTRAGAETVTYRIDA